MQGTLFVTGRKWWDLMSYHPTLAPYIVRVERDEEYIGLLEDALNSLTADIKKIVEQEG